MTFSFMVCSCTGCFHVGKCEHMLFNTLFPNTLCVCVCVYLDISLVFCNNLKGIGTSLSSRSSRDLTDLYFQEQFHHEGAVFYDWRLCSCLCNWNCLYFTTWLIYMNNMYIYLHTIYILYIYIFTYINIIKRHRYINYATDVQCIYIIVCVCIFK